MNAPTTNPNEEAIREQLLDDMRYFPKGLPPDGHIYAVRWGLKLFTGNDTKELIDRVVKEI